MHSYKRFAYYVTPTITTATDDRPSVDPEGAAPIVAPPGPAIEYTVTPTDVLDGAPDVDAN